MKKYVLLSMVSREKVINKFYQEKILSLFYKYYPNLFPQVANFCEPINQPISTVEEALKYWGGEPGLYRRKNTIVGSWYISTDGYHIFSPTIEYNWNKKIDWFILFKKLIDISKSYFGYVHVFTDQEIEPAAIGSAIGCFLRGTPSGPLKKNGIPQLAWANYFGEEYVKELDLLLIKQHGFEINPLGEGYVFNITDKIEDVITNYDHFHARRQELKSLFRPGLFQNYACYEHESKPIIP